MLTAEMKRETERSYIPAAGRRWLLPLYDPFLWLLGADRAKRLLIEQAEIGSRFHVLDVGCGTGSMTVNLKQLHEDADVVGIDPDPPALAICERKARRAGLSIEFDRGFADHLPYADSSFDRVLSSFMFHHLEANEKSATLSEINRVLREDGSLHLLDFAAAETDGGHGSVFFQDRAVTNRIESRMTSLMEEAGFVVSAEVSRGKILIGPIAYYLAVKRGSRLRAK